MNQPDLPHLPVEKLLSAKQVGGEFDVSDDTVLRWYHTGLPTGKEIPERFVRRRGFGEYLFHPAVLEFIRAEQAVYTDH
jgi:hypothetical protein